MRFKLFYILIFISAFTFAQEAKQDDLKVGLVLSDFLVGKWAAVVTRQGQRPAGLVEGEQKAWRI